MKRAACTGPNDFVAKSWDEIAGTDRLRFPKKMAISNRGGGVGVNAGTKLLGGLER
jgi:hypothetical protein